MPTLDLDLFDTTPATIERLHRAGRRVICYVSVGTVEPQRPDSADFAPEVIGQPLSDYPDERWLDIRQLDKLAPLLGARLDLCRSKGFDAVEADNVDAFANNSGFALTPDDQLVFNRFVARAAHERGLSVGLKNDLDQIPALVADFDWALNEECVQFNECEAYRPFLDAGKAVLHVEYQGSLNEICAVAGVLGGRSSMIKNKTLDASRKPCPRR